MVEYAARTWAEAAGAPESELGSAPAADAEDLLRRLGYEMAGLAVRSKRRQGTGSPTRVSKS
jgi:hypothetical protein